MPANSAAAVADAYFAAVTAHDGDAVAALMADGAELHTGSRTLRGGAIGDFYRASLRDDLRPSPGPYIVDGDRLAVEIDLFVDGRHHLLADVFTVRNGLITSLRFYGSPIT